MPYPVSIHIESPADRRNRLTTALRPILALPHSILVGPLFWTYRTGGVGLLGAAAYVMAVMSWVTLLVSGKHLQGIQDFTRYYLRWRVRALAYMALFTDRYPPFGDDIYPATIEVAPIASPRDRTSIALRLVLALPHLVVLCFLMVAWFVVTAIAWVSIVFGGHYPASLRPFALGVLQWGLRVEVYLLLLVDAYPPWTFEPEQLWEPLPTRHMPDAAGDRG
jgi:hypothetical protein